MQMTQMKRRDGMKQKLVAIGIIALLLICVTGVVAASNAVKLFLYDQESQITVTQNDKGESMVPLRAFAEELGYQVKWDADSQRIMIIDKELILAAKSQDQKIALYGSDKNGEYENFKLQANGISKKMNWTSTANPTYAPQIDLQDVNGDTRKEIIVILTKGYGTGIMITEPHILDAETLEEYYIEDLTPILLKNVKSEIGESGVSIKVQGKETIVPSDQIEANKDNWFDSVSFKNSYTYELVNGKLQAQLAAQASPTDFIGELVVTFVYKEGMFQADVIEFVK
jgi:Copper amine oxidase N-terminal domain